MPLEDFPCTFAEQYPELIGHRIVVALSGGADSTALLHLLRHPQLQLELEAAHVHHGVRGAEADEDASFCQELATKLGVPFTLLRLEPGVRGVSGREATWRQLRYNALLELAAAHDAAAVATAHQRDDVAEGVLVQLLRGTGPRGLSGIAARTEAGVIRPLLAYSRAELVTWLRHHRLDWREDSSNHDLTHLRNRVRHNLLPVLEEVSPQLRAHLVHLAAVLAVDERFFARTLARQDLCIDPWHPRGGVAMAKLRALDPALRVRWLHTVVEQLIAAKVSRRQLELFDAMLEGPGPCAVTLARRWVLRRARGLLWLEPGTTPPAACRRISSAGLDEPLLGPWRLVTWAGATSTNDLWHWSVQGDTEVLIRPPRADDRLLVGERLRSYGRFASHHLPRHLRHTWPVCVVDGTIEWVPGVWQATACGSGASLAVEVVRR